LKNVLLLFKLNIFLQNLILITSLSAPPYRNSHTLINITIPLSVVVHTIYYIVVCSKEERNEKLHINGCKFLCLTKRLGKYAVVAFYDCVITKNKVVSWINRPTRFLSMRISISPNRNIGNKKIICCKDDVLVWLQATII
jgi:hypothetical protein